MRREIRRKLGIAAAFAALLALGAAAAALTAQAEPTSAQQPRQLALLGERRDHGLVDARPIALRGHPDSGATGH